MPADKKEEEDSKDEAKPTEAEVAPIVAEGLLVTRCAGNPVINSNLASTDTSAEVTNTEPTVAPKPTKRNSIFATFSREKKEKEVEEEKKEEIKSDAAESSEPVDTEVKPIEPAVGTPAVEKTLASSPPKPKFLSSFFDKKDKSPAIKVPEKVLFHMIYLDSNAPLIF